MEEKSRRLTRKRKGGRGPKVEVAEFADNAARTRKERDLRPGKSERRGLRLHNEKGSASLNKEDSQQGGREKSRRCARRKGQLGIMKLDKKALLFLLQVCGGGETPGGEFKDSYRVSRYHLGLTWVGGSD